MSIDANETRTTVYEAECLVYHSLVSWRVRFPRGVNFRRDGVSENGPEYYFFYFWNFKKSKSYVPKGIIHTRWRSCLHSMLQTTLLDHVVSIFFFVNNGQWLLELLWWTQQTWKFQFKITKKISHCMDTCNAVMRNTGIVVVSSAHLHDLKWTLQLILSLKLITTILSHKV